MKTRRHSVITALATAAILASAHVHAQQGGNVPANPRPADPTANLPSATGSQTTLPSGAVTGAGQPQGTVKQPNAGAPGGLEERARREARTGGSTGTTGSTAAGARATGSTAGGAAGASGTAGTSDGATGTRTRAARQARG
jgi:hypothetical protein